ncbi:NAD(P)-dependent oxidoreductase [Gryllotalpicola koreensis]|uniref:NAD(P)-dependent oxidoreductase n=2 Tax=Gryllotalpicola koreensis TaxID=993086 RepID=A0ABP7ZZ34_9MICO
MRKVGVIGTGRMGLPIARRWKAAGESIAVYDVAAPRCAEADPEGLTVAPNIATLARDSNVLVTILPDVSEVEKALTAALPALDRGSIWVDLSSSEPASSVRLSGLAERAGIEPVAAPMGGGPARAAAGTLNFYVAGRSRPVAIVAPLLGICGRVLDAGDVPAHAHAVKLLAILLWFGQAVAVTEAMLVGTGFGLDAELLRALLADSAGGSMFIDQDLPKLMAGDYMEDFGIDGCVTEMEALVELATRTGTPFALSRKVLELYRQALERYGPVPGELLAALLIEERAGRTIAHH